MGDKGYSENTLALAVVRGTPGVLVLRRRCFPIGHGTDWYDWAHTNVDGFTCSNDSEVVITEVLHDVMAALP